MYLNICIYDDGEDMCKYVVYIVIYIYEMWESCHKPNIWGLENQPLMAMGLVYDRFTTSIYIYISLHKDI